MASGPLPACVGDGTARLVNRVAVAYVHAEPFPMLPLLVACGTVTAPSPSQPASTHSGPDQLLHGHSQVERQPGDVDDATRRSPGPGLYSGRHQSCRHASNDLNNDLQVRGIDFASMFLVLGGW